MTEDSLPQLNKIRKTYVIIMKLSNWGILQQIWPNPPETADLVTFTGEIYNEKLHFWCRVYKGPQLVAQTFYFYQP